MARPAPHTQSHNALHMGWRRDLPDFRDFDENSTEIASILAKSKPLKKARTSLPSKVDLQKWFTPVEDQEQLGSCTANAGVGLMEYYQQRAYDEFIHGSRLFLYKATRTLDGYDGDRGAHLRTTMKAMALFGVCPEHHWQYQIGDFDIEPPAFCYAYGQNYRATRYYRIDAHKRSPNKVLTTIKELLAGKLPCMFGFAVYSSMPPLGDGKGEILMPEPRDRLEGGHAVVAVGYDDDKKIGRSKGALKIRNSWSTKWGKAGYGWLPYDYVTSGLAVDFWSLVQADFVSSRLFD